jgi:hypothetical protein
MEGKKMNDIQFSEISKKLDKIFAIIAIQTIEDKDDKISILKKLGFTSDEINPIVCVKNCRQMEGWKRK